MYRRAIGIIICILFISATVSSADGTNSIKKTNKSISFDRDILYVGGSGPNNYTNIQYAIDDASVGDTVFVYEGTYDELITINTTISLIGEDKDTTIINGSKIGDIVIINADNVNINGFTIKNSSSSRYGIDVKSDNSNISNNIFNENGRGINIIDTDNHSITGNTFLHHSSTVIFTDYSDYNIISGNIFADTESGIQIDIGFSEFNIISDNIFTFTWDGIRTWTSNNITITNNTLFGKGQKISINLYYSDDCSISGNNINNFNEGINLDNSNRNNIYNNKIIECNNYGIFLYRKNNYNIISDNILTDNNDNGIYLQGSSTNNTIYYNTISSSLNGIYIKYNTNSNDNIIYHNNLIDNNLNGLDGCSNNWNIDYPFGGNYWDDYIGDDNNRSQNQDIPGSDGIGDTEHNIPGGGSNMDYYPLMYPWGEQQPVANYTLFEEYGGYVFNASSSYDRDGEVVSFEWDFGDGATSQGMTVSHAYNESGTYDITLTTTDNEGYKGNLTKTIDAVKNYPPDIPSIDGPSSGKWGKPYYFTFQSSDNENSEIWYYIDWGDEHNTGWMGPFASGDEISEPHTWGSQDMYVVRCKAKDVYDFESDWSEFEINIPRTRILSYIRLKWLFEHYPILGRLLNLLI